MIGAPMIRHSMMTVAPTATAAPMATSLVHVTVWETITSLDLANLRLASYHPYESHNYYVLFKP
jgi:hypothetical protein